MSAPVPRAASAMSFENVEEVDGDNPFDDEEGDAFAAASGTDGDEALDWADIEDDDAPASKADMAADKQKAVIGEKAAVEVLPSVDGSQPDSGTKQRSEASVAPKSAELQPKSAAPAPSVVAAAAAAAPADTSTAGRSSQQKELPIQIIPGMPITPPPGSAEAAKAQGATPPAAALKQKLQAKFDAEAAPAANRAPTQAGTPNRDGDDDDDEEEESSGGGWGWGLGSLLPVGKLSAVAAGAVRDLRELGGSLERVLVDTVAPVPGGEGSGSGGDGTDDGGAPPSAAAAAPAVKEQSAAGAAAAAAAAAATGAAVAAVAGGGDGDGDSGGELDPDELRRRDILDRLQQSSQDNQLKVGLDSIDAQVEAAAVVAGKALTSLWGGLSGVARSGWSLSTTLAAKVEAATMEIAKDLVTTVDSGINDLAPVGSSIQGVAGRRLTQLRAALATTAGSAIGLMVGRPSGGDDDDDGDGNGSDGEASRMTFEEYVEVYGGRRLAEELEAFANELSRRANRLRAALPPEQQAEVDETLAVLSSVFHGPSASSGTGGAAAAAAAPAVAAEPAAAATTAEAAAGADASAPGAKGGKKSKAAQKRAASAAAAAAAKANQSSSEPQLDASACAKAMAQLDEACRPVSLLREDACAKIGCIAAAAVAAAEAAGATDDEQQQQDGEAEAAAGPSGRKAPDRLVRELQSVLAKRCAEMVAVQLQLLWIWANSLAVAATAGSSSSEIEEPSSSASSAAARRDADVAWPADSVQQALLLRHYVAAMGRDVGAVVAAAKDAAPQLDSRAAADKAPSLSTASESAAEPGDGASAAAAATGAPDKSVTTAASAAGHGSLVALADATSAAAARQVGDGFRSLLFVVLHGCTVSKRPEALSSAAPVEAVKSAVST